MRLVFSGCMIKLILLAICVSLYIVMCSVEKGPEPASDPINTRFTRIYFKDVDLYFLTDKETGAEYLIHYKGGLIKLEKTQSTNP